MNPFLSSIYVLLCLFLSATPAFASDNKISTFETYVQEQKEGFNTYKEQHRRFVSLLKQEWQAYQAQQSIVRDPIPKLPKAPVIKGSDFEPPTVALEQPNTQQPRSVPYNPSSNIPNTDNLAQDIQPIEDEVVQTDEHITADNFLFYGNEIALSPLPTIPLTARSEAALQEYWRLSAEANFDATLEILRQQKTTLALSDWAVFLLIQEYVKQYIDDTNQFVAANWFLLNAMGYEARIAAGEVGLILLMTSEQSLYDMPYYQIDGKKYYQLLGETSQQVRTYQGEFDKSNKAFDMSFNKTLITEADVQYRHITAQLHGEKLDIDVPYDLQRIKYLSTYPQLDLQYYFSAPVDPITAQALRQSVAIMLTGSRDSQVSQLLGLIHQSFPYAVDQEQFGYENYLLVEESLHYQASDCEDRSVLFAWLAKNILQEPVVGLNYEGHVATALTRNGRLVSADPTYLGAQIGDIMPDYQGVRPKIIRF